MITYHKYRNCLYEMSNQDTSGSSSYYETAAESPNASSMYSDISSTSFSDVSQNSSGDTRHFQIHETVFGDEYICDSVTETATTRPSTVITLIPGSGHSFPPTPSSVGHPSTLGTVTVTSSSGGQLSGTSTPSTLKTSPIVGGSDLDSSIHQQVTEVMDFSPNNKVSRQESLSKMMDMVDSLSSDVLHITDALKLIGIKVQEADQTLLQLRTLISTNFQISTSFQISTNFQDSTVQESTVHGGNGYEGKQDDIELSTPELTPQQPIGFRAKGHPSAKKSKVTPTVTRGLSVASGTKAKLPKVTRTPVRAISTPRLVPHVPGTSRSPLPSKAVSRCQSSTAVPLTEESKQKLYHLPAMVKGYLTRRLLNTDKMKDLIWSLRDTINELNAFKVPEVPTEADRIVHENMVAHLEKCVQKFHQIMIGTSVPEQMSLIAQSREALVKAGIFNAEVSTLMVILSSSRPQATNKRTSSATVKAILRKTEGRAASSPPYLNGGRQSTANGHRSGHRPLTGTKRRSGLRSAHSSTTSSRTSTASGPPRESLEQLRTGSSKGPISRIVKKLQPVEKPVPQPRPRKVNKT